MKVAVVGGGPAGMMAAISSAQNGAEVTLFEKNEKLGKKMYISGKGRCNITNECAVKDFIANVCANPRFLYGALSKFSPYDLMDFCEEIGLRLKTERGNRVFPVSDKSSDVIKAFSRCLRELNVKICLNSEISAIEYRKNSFLLTTITDILTFDKVIIATGGVSYRATGSTGDGYAFSKMFGHSVTALRSALCRIICKGTEELEGLSLKNVDLSICNADGVTLDSEFGETLFTDNGISGPAALTLSSRINKLATADYFVEIDLKPALDDKKLDARILRDFSEGMNKDFINSLDGLVPARLSKTVAIQSGIPFCKKVNQITAIERAKLTNALKHLRFKYSGLDDIEHGIVTSGGVDVKEIYSSTMESKLQSGLFFAGEVLDVDAYTGGYNIQIALSTGYVAGTNAAKEG